jgi:site-specific recombinase XerD
MTTRSTKSTESTNAVAVIQPGTLSQATQRMIEAWSSKATNVKARHGARHMVAKRTTVTTFFNMVNKDPMTCGPADVMAWIEAMRKDNYQENSIYAKVSTLSSFYAWIAKESGRDIKNPVDPVRPKAPKPYQTEKSKSLSDDELQTLTAHLRDLAYADDAKINNIRDYAMFVFYMASGMRLNEILQLTWGRIKFPSDGGLIIETRVKGGEVVQKEIAQDSAIDALRRYLGKSGRMMESMRKGDAIWVSHSPGNTGKTTLTEVGYWKSMKRRAREAGISDFHPHMTRHTHARILAEETGSLSDVQDSLGHSNQQTTRVYVKRLGIRRDKHSNLVMKRMG